MIDILVPSKGRPNRLQTMINSCYETADTPEDISVIVFLDRDDYYELDLISDNVSVIQGKQEVLSKLWNNCFRYGQGEICMHAADDIVFESKGWDTIVRDYFAKNEIGLIYGDDCHQDKWATHSFTSRKAADILGYFCPPYFEADYNDIWLTELYLGIKKICYTSDLVIKHLHRNLDSKFDDSTYKLAEARRERATKVWEQKQPQLQEDIKRLRSAMSALTGQKV